MQMEDLPKAISIYKEIETLKEQLTFLHNYMQERPEGDYSQVVRLSLGFYIIEGAPYSTYTKFEADVQSGPVLDSLHNAIRDRLASLHKQLTEML